ncbi:MAG: DNA polymerase III subunit alpha [Alphaproteobacteria bacterium]|nr:DNA polymerase III subunit alpha [Alphaproteobacteria bacterium]
MTCSYYALRNHTPYSLLEGAIPTKTLIERASEHNMMALGIADTGHLFGALEFSLACQKKGIHPIIGTQLSWIHPSSLTPYPLVVFAQNHQGYQNLCRLVSASTVGQKTAWRGSVTWDQLKQFGDNILVLTGGIRGAITQHLERDCVDTAKTILHDLAQQFDQRLYIELQREEALPEEGCIDPELSDKRLDGEQQLIQWAFDFGLPLIATNQAMFLNPDDHEAHDALRCVALGRYIYEEDRPRVSPYCFFRSPDEMVLLFADVPEAITNTHHLCNGCSFLLRAQPPALPSFPCGQPEPKELSHQAQGGLNQRLQNEVYPLHPVSDHDAVRRVYQNRLDYECDMIVRMGFSGYFLIVSDFIQWAKNNGIPVGPGRGSGASSLVAWSLFITDVDPIRFELFFERFLNPDRVSMPDFDVDFCQERRDEVIAYVRDKYGAAHVAHIITFGTLQSRAVLRDVGRVLQMPYGQVDKICKLIPHNPAAPVSLKEAIKLEPQLETMAAEDDQVKKLLDIGLKLEGLYRHASTHAAGVIISKEPLTDVVPLYQDEGSALPATEFSMKYVESAGLVKFDFLGLKTLTVLQTTVQLLRQRQVEVVLTAIALDDSATFQLLARAETVGLFQLESAGMSDVLRQLQPEHFNEIIALVALYRPGPMDDIPRYLACRHGKEIVSYPYACLEDILKETFGVMVYQEQVLQIARTLAGYSLGGADLLRRAMGKKIKSEMDAQRKTFVDGVVKTYGGDRTRATTLFDHIAKFASYAFPKAHATPYALISYQTAYLKANYPVEFMTALMIHDAHNVDKLRLFVRESRRMGIEILPPDINASDALFSIEQGECIRYGLAALKGVGTAVMEKLVENRIQNGPFQSVSDCIQRIGPLGLNKKNLESLIAAGAFDGVHPGQRAALWASTELLLRGSGPSETGSLLFPMENKCVFKEAMPWSMYEALDYERQAIGFYLTAHPLEGYPAEKFVLSECITQEMVTEQKTFPMMGMVLEMTEKISKTGKKYAFLQLSDPTGGYEVTLFSELLAQHRGMLVPGAAVALKVSGRVAAENIRLSATEVYPIDVYTRENSVVLNLPEDQVSFVCGLLSQAPSGTTRITVCVTILSPGENLLVRILLPNTYRLTPSLRSHLQTFLAPLL